MGWSSEELDRAIAQARQSLECAEVRPGPLVAPTPQVQRAAAAIEQAVARGQATQRWREQQSIFIPISDVFRAADYRVEVAGRTSAKEFVEEHHYSASFASSRLAVGLYHVSAGLVGVAVFGVPPYGGVKGYQRERYRKDGRFYEIVKKTRDYVTYTIDNGEPIRVEKWQWEDMIQGAVDLRMPKEVFVELNRFVLLDEVPFSAESWFLARAFELVQQQLSEVLVVVSFADPVPRYSAKGTLVMPGHLGTIYQAFNAIFRALSSPKKVKLHESGLVIPKRVIEKIESQGIERGGIGGYGEEKLIAMGVEPRRSGEPGKVWLRRVLSDETFTTIRHTGNYTYLWTIGPRRRGLRKLLRPSLPYPGDPVRKAMERALRKHRYGR